MIMKNVYQGWLGSYKELMPIKNTLRQMDAQNGTTFLQAKDHNEELLKSAAKEAHENKGLYYVTIFDKSVPAYFLEINKDFFRVNFLDEKQRIYLSYDFQGISNKKLFLTSVFFWEFIGDTDKKKSTTNYLFKENGYLTIIETDSKTRKQIIKEAKNKIDVSENYEEYPEFGNYDFLIKKERLYL